jgi:hypothetical protein
MQIQSDDKINIVDNKIIIACTGAVGLSQRFYGVVKSAWNQRWARLFEQPFRVNKWSVCRG